MALTKCAECQQTVSDKAASCPHCGAPFDAIVAPPPLPSPEPQQEQQKGSVARRAAAYIVAGLAGMFLLLYIIDYDQTPSQPDTQVTGKERAAVVNREADELAHKQIEEAECEADLKCIGNKKSIEATFKCVPYVEQLAKNNFEWIDQWYQPKFSHFRWSDQKNLVVTYLGDRIKYQNGFGAWVLSRYECDYSVPTSTVLDVRASAGRLPP